MKHLKNILPLFFSVALITACAPNVDESNDEVEVYNEEPISPEVMIEEDSIFRKDTATTDFESTETNSEVTEEEVSADIQVETTELANKNQETVVAVNTPAINKKEGVKLSKESGFDLMSYAAEEVALLKKENCEGGNCGTKIQMESISSNKTIVAVVMINWKEGSTKNKELREYKLKPESTIDIGCSQTCGEEGIRYNWKIVSAKYN